MSINIGAIGGDSKSTDTSWIVKEIQAMMYGMGDSNSPLLASAVLVEEVMVRQLRSAVVQAEEVATLRGSPIIQAEDFIFLMRKDKTKIQRLVKYLALKDMKEMGFGKLSTMTDTVFVNDVFGTLEPSKKRSQDCVSFLNSVCPNLQLEKNIADIVKHERNVRADKISSSLKPEKYAEYVTARRASFSNTPTKISLLYDRLFSQEIDTSEEPNLSQSCYDILGYLGFETVAQIVDMTLLVRQDSYAQVGNPVSRYMPSSQTHPYTVPTNKQIEGASPLTPAEIREALRRFWSPQFSSFRSGSNIHTRLLAI